MPSTRGPGRPATFDHDEVVRRSIDVLWQRGLTGATTRVLERELGLSQSSLYNTFGSKADLVDLAVDRYTAMLEVEVVSLLEAADRPALLDFVSAVARWVDGPDHRGCLILNLAVESPDQSHRLERYRQRLRQAIEPAVADFTDGPELIGHRTELLVTAVVGLSLAARTGADRAELDRLRRAIEGQINDW